MECPTLLSLGLVALVIGVYAIAKCFGVEQDYKDLVLPLILVTVPVFLTQAYTKAISAAEIKVKYVQIASDILSRPPSKEPDVIDMRKWATTLIKKYFPVEVNEATERAMIYGRADIHEAPDTLDSTGTAK